MKNKLRYLCLISLAFITLSCSSVRVNYPVPEFPERPNITFRNCVYNNQEKPEICLSVLDTRELIKYVLLLELELAKCSITIEEINKQ